MKKTKLDKIYEARDAFISNAEALLFDIENEEDEQEIAGLLADLSNLTDDMLGEIDIPD